VLIKQYVEKRRLLDYIRQAHDMEHRQHTLGVSVGLVLTVVRMDRRSESQRCASSRACRRIFAHIG